MIYLGFKDNMIRKLQQSFNDKKELNQQALDFQKRFKEVEKALKGGKGK